MSATGLPVFDTTLQKTNVWLNEIMYELGWRNRHKAYQALRAALHILRDHIPPEEAVQLGAQLPMLIRGIYYEGWKPSITPIRERNKAEFLDQVYDYFPNDPDVNAEDVLSAVFKVLSDRVPGGEIDDIIGILPRGIRHYWPQFIYEALPAGGRTGR